MTDLLILGQTKRAMIAASQNWYRTSYNEKAVNTICFMPFFGILYGIITESALWTAASISGPFILLFAADMIYRPSVRKSSCQLLLLEAATDYVQAIVDSDEEWQVGVVDGEPWAKCSDSNTIFDFFLGGPVDTAISTPLASLWSSHWPRQRTIYPQSIPV